MYRILPLRSEVDDYGVYASHRVGEFGTPLVFRGTLEECLRWRREKG